MQIKHTFLFTLILGLGWTMYVFAYATGPDPGYNGLYAGDCTSCHVGRVNSGSGSLTVSGLPASWTPGQTYPLTVTVPKPSTSHIYGFQLSVVSDGTNQQAGSLARGNNVQVICGNGLGNPPYPGMNCTSAGAVQFAEHLSAGANNAFTFNWTAPSSASVGTVRFNVAGNAGNGDGTDLGDLIYTSVIKVAAAAPPPPPPDLSTHAFTMVDRGGVSLITDGSGAQTAGYSVISPASGSTTPTGVAIFGFRTNNVLVSETGVPATPLLTQGRIYAEIAGTLDTGVAIANPNSSPATINFSFTNAAGASAGSGTTTIPANSQIAQFLDQAPLKVYTGTSFQGTFNFTSTVPVGVVALRGLTNERGEFLMSTLPVVDTTAAPGTGTVVIPHFADGAGWVTQIFLVNPTSAALSGTVRFTDGNGNASRVQIGTATNSSFPYSIPAGSSQKLATAGNAGSSTLPATGSVAVVPGAGGTTPVALVVFSYKPGTVTVSEAGVPVNSGTALRSYVETAQTGNIATGLAVANTTSSPTMVTFELSDLNGASVGSASANLPASGQTAKFLSELFPGLPSTFKGVLRISSSPSIISVVGLRTRTNERGDFLITTTPPSNEAGTPTSADLLFPHLVNGGGYTTQFILFSGTAGQTSSGTLHFFTQNGSPFNLTVN